MEHNEKSTTILGIILCFRGDAQKHYASISEHKISALTKTVHSDIQEICQRRSTDLPMYQIKYFY